LSLRASSIFWTCTPSVLVYKSFLCLEDVSIRNTF
jgi:hypothetical protein